MKRLCSFLVAVLLSACAVPATAKADALRIADVLQMDRAALDGSDPHTVTGLVSFVMSWLPSSVIVTDPDNPDGPAVYVTDIVYGPELAKGFDALCVGDLVELTAHPVRMRLEPGLYVTDVRRLGHRDLTLPAYASVSSILSGRRNNCRVRIRAVLVSACVEGAGTKAITLLSLSADDGRITVRVRGSHPELALLRDAEVEVSGVVLPVINLRQEFCTAEIEALEGPASVACRKPPPGDSFAVETCEGTGVFSWWAKKGVGQHAVKVFGEVTYVDAAEGAFVVQSDTTAVLTYAEGNGLPRLGDCLEVVGFPAMRTDTGVLMNARWRPAPEVAPVAAYPLSFAVPVRLDAAGDLNNNDMAYRLVEVEGEVVKVTSAPDAPLAFLLNAGAERVTVALPFAPDAAFVSRLEDRPRLRVRGVLEMRLNRDLDYARYFVFSAFSVRARSCDDIEILPDIPWLVRRALRFARWALVLLFVLVAGAMGVSLVRRHRARDRQAAIAADRRRIAGELHDTIAQHISGAKLWVFAAKTASGEDLNESARTALEMAEKVLDATRREMREAILDLQSDELLSESLAALVRRLARVSDVPGKVRVRTKLEGLPETLDVRQKRDILAIVQETLSNAVRHGAARNVIVVSEGTGEDFTLSVLNDGVSFDAEAAPGPEAGHFGLANMRTRAARAGVTVAFGRRRGYSAVIVERKTR